MSPPRSFASQVVVLPGGYWSWRPRRINMDKPYQHIVTKTTHKTHIYTTMLISSNTTKYHILSHDYLGIGLCTICICIIYGVLHTYHISYIIYLYECIIGLPPLSNSSMNSTCQVPWHLQSLLAGHLLWLLLTGEMDGNGAPWIPFVVFHEDPIKSY